jgi:hypothetical protein
MTFEEWLGKVDRHIGKVCGLGHNDLVDQPWWDWWNDEVRPREAARWALEEEGFPF